MLDKTVGFLGECLVELKGSPQKGITQGYAGDTLNAALYFNRLLKAAGATTHYITALGVDAFSCHMLEFIQHEGIKTDFVLRHKDKLPGIYAINVDVNGERSFSYWRDQAAAKFYFDEHLNTETFQALSQLDALYLSGISLAILPDAGRSRLFDLIDSIKANGGVIYFDNNFRPKLWPDVAIARAAYEKVLKRADIALLTLEDEALLFGSNSAEAVLERLAPLNIPEIVIKQGKDACVISGLGDRVSVNAQRVDMPIDTTAAGDSFGAAYLACRMAGGDACMAAQAGHRLAAAVIQFEGAIVPETNMPKDLVPSA